MKRTLSILALVGLLSTTASAVTISWNASAASSSLKGLTSGTALTTGADSQTASLTMYYFNYADYDAIIGLGKVDASDENLQNYVVASAAGQTAENTSAAGRVKASSKNTDYEDAGVSFFARAYATFDGKSYFIDLFGGTGTDNVWTMTSTGDARTTQAFKWEDGTYGGATATAAGTKNAWVAVPEPSTAMLALAGLALLIKRRRAYPRAKHKPKGRRVSPAAFLFVWIAPLTPCGASGAARGPRERAPPWRARGRRYSLWSNFHFALLSS